MSILTVVQSACLRESLERPSTLFPEYDEGDTTPHDMLEAITSACRDLRDGYDWTVSKARHTFEALGAETQTGKLPSDFQRLVMNTFWSEALRKEVCGPMSDEDYAEHKSGAIGRIDPAFMMLGDDLLLAPAPTAGDDFAFTYIRSAIGKTSVGTRLAAFTADTDNALWDDELVKLGTIFHYRKMKGYPSEQAAADLEKCRRDRIKRDGGGRSIRMGAGNGGADAMVSRMKSAVIIAS